MIIPRPLKKVLGKIIPFSQEDKVPTFNLGSGTADSTTYLRGDGTWSTVTGTASNKMYTVGRNSTGSTLHKGTIVYISGSTGNRPNFVKAQANSEATSAGTFGVIEADIPNNSDGNCVTIGTLDNLDTRTTATYPFTDVTLADGDTIYLHPTIAGYVTNVKPSAPNHLVYVGKVVRTSPTLGTIVYRIQNGYEIDELHDVAITSPTNGQILQYESATSLWKNVTPSSGGLTVGTTAITSGTAGRVLFEDATNKLNESANFYWDNTNSRLSIGQGSSPGAVLDVRAAGALSTDIALRVRNSANTVNSVEYNGNGSKYWRAHSGDMHFMFDPANNRIHLKRTGIYSITTDNAVTELGLSCNVGNASLRGGSNMLNIVNGGNFHFEENTGTLATSGAGAIVLKNRTAPSTNVVDRHYYYSADRGGTAGKASAHFRCEDGTINVLGDLSGFGTSSPGARVDVIAQGALSTDLAFRVRNSAGTANVITANGKGLVWSNGPGYVSSNCAFGELAMNANTTGAQNTAFGYNALTTATTGGQNTAVGWGAIQLTTGAGNTAIGYGAGQLNAGGTYNTYLGYSAGQLGTTAIGGVFIGYAAGQSSNATNAICIGYTAGTNAGNGSIAIGYNSGPGTGSHNFSVGQSAGVGMTTGSFNMHLGYRSVASGVTTGNYNTLIGSDIVVGNVSNNAVLADMQGNQAIKKDANHNVVLGKETALATNATNGFAYLPTCAGTPTGVPAASFTGKAPVVIDSTNNKMYIYSGGAWVALN